jgi:hypothetical protein
MWEWMSTNWVTLISLPFGGGVVAGAIKLGPRAIRRVLIALDCETDRVRWQERDRLRDGEIALLRRQVEDLQTDVARLVTRSVASGAVSEGATTPASLTTIPRPTSAP